MKNLFNQFNLAVITVLLISILAFITHKGYLFKTFRIVLALFTAFIVAALLIMIGAPLPVAIIISIINVYAIIKY